jgi:hypothetical protein
LRGVGKFLAALKKACIFAILRQDVLGREPAVFLDYLVRLGTIKQIAYDLITMAEYKS